MNMIIQKVIQLEYLLETSLEMTISLLFHPQTTPDRSNNYSKFCIYPLCVFLSFIEISHTTCM